MSIDDSQFGKIAQCGAEPPEASHRFRDEAIEGKLVETAPCSITRSGGKEQSEPLRLPGLEEAVAQRLAQTVRMPATSKAPGDNT